MNLNRYNWEVNLNRNIIITFILAISAAFAGNKGFSAESPRTILDIKVESNVTIPVEMVINQSGLKIGSMLSPNNVSSAIKNLWHLGLFSDIKILREEVEAGVVVTIELEVLPQVNSITATGFKEISEREALNAIRLSRNMYIGDFKVARMKRQLLEMYHEKGFILAEADFRITPLENDPTKVDVVLEVNEGNKVEVKSLRFVGNNNLSARAIKRVMDTQEDRWYRSGDFNQQVFDEDKNTIVALYKSQGFRDAAVVRDSISQDERSDKINITIFIEEGQKYKFGDILIDGNSELTTEELKKHVKFGKGDTFNEQLVLMSGEFIRSEYHNNGYLQAAVMPVQYAYGDTVDIHYDIAEGRVSRVKRVIIEGNTKSNEKIIRREIQLLPGMAFNRSILERSYRDIMALNFFQNVDFNYEPAEEENEINLRFNVQEKQTGVYTMGAGYSERDHLVGTIGLTNYNLFGRGQSLTFNWDMGSRRRTFQIAFTEPWLLDTPTILSVNLYNTTRSDYTTAFDNETRRGGYIRVGRRLNWPDDYSRAFLTYRLDDVSYTNPSEYYSMYLIPGVTSSLSFNFSRDSRDLPVFATRGTLTHLTTEVAGGILGGDLDYHKYILSNEVNIPMPYNMTLTSRTRVGYLRGYSDNRFVPYSERFMPGGISYDGQVRGYPNRKVGPLIGGQEIGGETMFVSNLELQIPLVQQTIYGVAFFDAGNAWENIRKTDPFDLKRSVGLGARMYIPQLGGMVGFDFGYGLDKLEGTDARGGWRTHFQFGNQGFMY